MSEDLTDFLESFVVMRQLMGKGIKYNFYKSFNMNRYKIYDLDSHSENKNAGFGLGNAAREFCSIHTYNNEKTIYALFELSDFVDTQMIRTISMTSYKKEIDRSYINKTIITFEFENIEELKEMFLKCFLSSGRDLAI